MQYGVRHGKASGRCKGKTAEIQRDRALQAIGLDSGAREVEVEVSEAGMSAGCLSGWCRQSVVGGWDGAVVWVQAVAKKQDFNNYKTRQSEKAFARLNRAKRQRSTICTLSLVSAGAGYRRASQPRRAHESSNSRSALCQ